MNHRNEFGAYYQKHFKTGVGVEIGVQVGLFAEIITRDWKGKYIGVDMWPNYAQFDETKRRLAGRDVDLKYMESKTAAATIGDETLDWVFIDAGHRYEEVKADLEAWYPKVRKGGIVSGHDYVKYQDFGVIEAVNEFAAAHGYTVSFTETDMWQGVNFISWYFTKHE